MHSSSWTPDHLTGFEQLPLHGMTAWDGPPDPVLVRRLCPRPARGAVLYLHGFNDYFFQSHLGEFYNDLGLDFYALELRRHGRALQAHQLPNYTANLDEFFEDMDHAIEHIRQANGQALLVLNGHSTGGLLAALYGHRGRYRDAIAAMVLTSPFFSMNISDRPTRLAQQVLAKLGRYVPKLRLPSLPALYGQTLHSSCQGRWNFDLRWKPVNGFPVYTGWLHTISQAQAELKKGLNIACPVLLLHAQRSASTSVQGPDSMSADIVLNVADMVRLAPGLGQRVELCAIADGIHDLSLSLPAAQTQFFEQLASWLTRTLDLPRRI
jgi:alpha-beta hydrolase superfamily lysophospholipase